MALKPTKLIVRSNPDDLLKVKTELIESKEKNNQLVKYSDEAVETKSKLYIFKVVPLPRNILDQIRGYVEVDAAELLADLDKFVEEVRAVCEKEAVTPPEAGSDSPSAPQGDQKVDPGGNTQGEQNSGGNQS